MSESSKVVWMQEINKFQIALLRGTTKRATVVGVQVIKLSPGNSGVTLMSYSMASTVEKI